MRNYVVFTGAVIAQWTKDQHVMLFTFEIARAFSIAAFLFFGVTCLISPYMREEFQRYRLARFRTTVGLLQLLGAIGMLVGFVFPMVLIVATGGLTALMFLGIITRVKIGDSLVETLPAAFFFLLNGFILFVALGLA